MALGFGGGALFPVTGPYGPEQLLGGQTPSLAWGVGLKDGAGGLVGQAFQKLHDARVALHHDPLDQPLQVGLAQ